MICKIIASIFYVSGVKILIQHWQKGHCVEPKQYVLYKTKMKKKKPTILASPSSRSNVQYLKLISDMQNIQGHNQLDVFRV